MDKWKKDLGGVQILVRCETNGGKRSPPRRPCLSITGVHPPEIGMVRNNLENIPPVTHRPCIRQLRVTRFVPKLPTICYPVPNTHMSKHHLWINRERRPSYASSYVFVCTHMLGTTPRMRSSFSPSCDNHTRPVRSS